MSSSARQNEVPIKFTPSESDDQDGNQNIKKIANESEDCPKQQNGCTKNGKRKDKTKYTFGRKWLLKLSVANLFIGLLNMSFGITIFVERKELSHWLTECAFSIWYGSCVFATGMTGLEYFRRKSFAKGVIHLLLNIVSLVLTVPSLAFYGKVTTHYRHIRERKILIQCKNIVSTNASCNAQYETLATNIAALYGILLVSSIVEIFVSFFLCGCSSTFRLFCKKIFLNTEESQMQECSMFNPGVSYPISSLHSSYNEYQIDSTPLKPVKAYKKVCTRTNVPPATNKQIYRISPHRNRPAFKAMESITESLESTDYENEAPVATKEEEEKYQRESLLP